VDKAAAALLSQHGERALRVAEERARRHEIARQEAARNLWRAVAEAIRQKASPARHF
jgi:hypothetical protein